MRVPATGRVDTQTIAAATETYAYFDLCYDVAGNVTGRVEKLWRLGTTGTPASTAGDTGTGVWSYDYDGAGRMTSATGPNAAGTSTAWTYTYDGMGNRLSETEGSVSETFATDDQGWPTTMDSSATGSGTDVTYGFNPDGGLETLDATTGPDQGFTFDSWGDTAQATAGATTVDYTVDALGRQIARTVGAATTSVTFAGATEDPVRTTGTATTISSFTPGGPLATKTGTGTPSVYLRDLHGDVVGTIATGSAGQLTDTAWFSPYGERQVLAGSAPTFGYQGDPTDPTSGAVDMTTRDYLPGLGRFSTRDVLYGEVGEPPSLNQFVYAGGSPVTYWDPLGMEQGAAGEGIGRPGRNDRNGRTDGDDDTGAGTGSNGDGAGGRMTLGEFASMSMAERLEWLSGFQSASRAQGWFYAIQAVIEKFDRLNVRPGSYLGVVDAHILFSIQEGYALYQGGRSVAVGAAEWRTFFQQLGRGSSTGVLAAAWARAESVATRAGDRLAREVGLEPTGQESAFFKVTSTYRESLAQGASVPLPNDLSGSRAGVEQAWAYAGVGSFQPADILDPFHFFREASVRENAIPYLCATYTTYCNSGQVAA